MYYCRFGLYFFVVEFGVKKYLQNKCHLAAKFGTKDAASH